MSCRPCKEGAIELIRRSGDSELLHALEHLLATLPELTTTDSSEEIAAQSQHRTVSTQQEDDSEQSGRPLYRRHTTTATAMLHRSPVDFVDNPAGIKDGLASPRPKTSTLPLNGQFSSVNIPDSIVESDDGDNTLVRPRQATQQQRVYRSHMDVRDTSSNAPPDPDGFHDYQYTVDAPVQAKPLISETKQLRNHFLDSPPISPTSLSIQLSAFSPPSTSQHNGSEDASSGLRRSPDSRKAVRRSRSTFQSSQELSHPMGSVRNPLSRALSVGGDFKNNSSSIDGVTVHGGRFHNNSQEADKSLPLVTIEMRRATSFTVEPSTGQLTMLETATSVEQTPPPHNLDLSTTYPHFSGIVAVDLGATSRSYVCYLCPTDVSTPDIICSTEEVDSLTTGLNKTSAAMLLDSSQRFHTSGPRAREFFLDLDPVEARTWFYLPSLFKQFFLEKNEDVNDDSISITSSNGDEIPLETALSHLLTHIRREILDQISRIRQEDAAETEKSIVDSRLARAQSARSPGQVDKWKEPTKSRLESQKSIVETARSRTETVDGRPRASSFGTGNRLLWIIGLPGPSNHPGLSQVVIRAAERAGIMRRDFCDQQVVPLCKCQAAYYWSRQLSTPQDYALYSTPRLSLYANSRAALKRNSSRPDKNRWLIALCGGEFLTMVVLERNFTGTNHVKEVFSSQQAGIGGQSVNLEFFRFLGTIFGSDFISAYQEKHPLGWSDLEEAFESRKRAVTTVVKETAMHHNIVLPFNFMIFHDKLKGYSVDTALRRFNDREVFWTSQGMIRITATRIRQLFVPTITKIREAIRHVVDTIQGIGTVVLSGGFAECTLLQQGLRDELMDKVDLIVPNDPSVAVLKGLLQFGLSLIAPSHHPLSPPPPISVPSSTSDTTSIPISVAPSPSPSVSSSSRPPLHRSKYTFGVARFKKHRPNVDPPDKCTILDGVAYCTVAFDRLIAAGTILEPRPGTQTSTSMVQKFTHCFSKVRHYRPANPTDATLVLMIYRSVHKSPQWVTQDGVETVGHLIFHLTPQTDKKVGVTLKATFVFTEIDLFVLAIDDATQNRVATEIQYLPGKNYL